MSKFKVGDLVRAKEDSPYYITNDKAKHPFVVKQIKLNTTLLDDMVVEVHPEDVDDLEEIDRDQTYPVNSEYFELAQPWLNEQKLKKALGL